MNKMNFSPFPNMTTERLTLRQLKIEDENEFFFLKSDERVLKFLNTKAKTFEEARQFLYKLNDGIAKNEWILWAINLKNENKLIGTICFWNISEEQAKAEIGYELMPDFQGKGIMHEAFTAVIEYGFEKMNLHLIEAFPNANNLKSVKLLERNGFIKEASSKEDDFSEREIPNMVIYKLVNKDTESIF